MRAWTFVFATLTALLCVAVACVVRENRRLHGQIARLVRASERAAALEVGDVLTPFTLRDGAGHDVAFDFDGGEVGSLLLFHASSCDACLATRAHWRQALERAARPDMRVLCIQTDAGEDAPLALEGLPPSLAVPLPPQGWLAAIPAVPATLVVDEHGRLTHAWYRQLDETMASELVEALARLGGGPR